MGADLTRVRVKHHSEETHCDNCGWPFDVGDTYQLTPADEPVCGVQCARELHARDERREAGQEGVCLLCLVDADPIADRPCIGCGQ